ncbi:MAG: hypothetical protein J6S14_08265 [Clostridia bacterium]|nr:hypothetical protein [Clostridia bacterium]
MRYDKNDLIELEYLEKESQKYVEEYALKFDRTHAMWVHDGVVNIKAISKKLYHNISWEIGQAFGDAPFFGWTTEKLKPERDLCEEFYELSRRLYALCKVALGEVEQNGTN